MMPDKTYFCYELASGALIEIENVPQTRRGAAEASSQTKREPVPFRQIIAPIGEVVELLFDQVRSVVNAPDQVTLELGIALKGGTSVVLVSGETQASLKLTLQWDAKRAELSS